MIAAAWLHDVVEDTKIELDMIEKIFGTGVAYLVGMLTDNETGNRKERKRLSRIRLGNACAEVQTIKLADLIDNTKTIAQYDPEFAKVYMQEKRELVDVLIKGDRTLWQMANQQLDDYFKGQEA